MTGAAEYREAMSCLLGAVNIVTTDGQAGPGGFTASAVCSVTDQPPTLLVCMNRNSRQNRIFKENAVLCVNVLTAAQRGLSDSFSRGGNELQSQFTRAAWDRLVTGSPCLVEALACFDSKIVQTVEVGTHSVFFCQVEVARAGQGGDSLAYVSRTYRRVSRGAAQNDSDWMQRLHLWLS